MQHAHEQIEVRASAPASVERTHPLEQPWAEEACVQDRRAVDDVLLAESLGTVVVDVDQRLGTRRGRAEDLCTAGHHLRTGMSDERAADRGEGPRGEDVVGVEEPHDVAGREFDATIYRVVQAVVGSSGQPYAWLGAEELERGIDRTTVHHDVLQIWPLLCANTGEGIGEVMLGVQCRGDEADPHAMTPAARRRAVSSGCKSTSAAER